MRLLLLSGFVMVSLGCANAELPPPNAAGVTIGHMHLNVNDVVVQKKFWTGLFSATPLKREGFEGVKVPGMIILFTMKEPTGPSEGATIDHLGFKVHNTEEKLKQARDLGYTTRPVFKGAEGNPNAYIDGPDRLKVEVQQDDTLTGPPTPNHVHYQVKDNAGLRDWYVKTFSAVARNRGNLPITADISTMNLTFSSFREDTPRATTKGRLASSCLQNASRSLTSNPTYRSRPATYWNNWFPRPQVCLTITLLINQPYPTP